MENPVKQSLIELINSCSDLQFVTFTLDGQYPETRHVTNAMNCNVSELNLFYMTNNKSHKYQQVAKNPHVCVYYSNPKTKQAASLFGFVELVHDPVLKKRHWKDEYIKEGYSGYNDQDLAILHFIPKKYKFHNRTGEKTGKIYTDKDYNHY